METVTQSTLTGQELFNFQKEKGYADKLIGQFSEEIKKCETRRELRLHVVDLTKERDAKRIEPDETIIPIRVIDTNINQDKPGQIAFLEQSRRLVLFKDKLNPGESAENLEIQFSNFMRYEDWNIPWHRLIDASALHGGAWMEVRFDPTKPLNSALEYVPREEFIFPLKAKSIQKCCRVIRKFEFYPHQLENLIGVFDEKVVKIILSDNREKPDDPLPVYRVWVKHKDQVYIYWYSQQQDDFLRKPEPLKLGLYQEGTQLTQNSQAPQLPVKSFPIFFLPYEVTENLELLCVKGRAYKDLPTQECLTQLWSNMVNASSRSSAIYGSWENVQNTEPSDARQVTEIKKNTILGRKANFWSFPPPNPVILQVAQALDIKKQAETGNVDFAVNNRKDSRKTATEIEAATRQSSMASAVDIVTLSGVIKDVYSLCWEIARSQILAGAIQDFGIPPEVVAKPYLLSAAGSVDVVLRQEKMQLVKETAPLMMNTPAGPVFLKYLIDTFFPEEAEIFKASLEQADPRQMISMLANILASMPQENLPPEQVAQLNQILQQAQAYVQAGQQKTPGGVSPGLVQ